MGWASGVSRVPGGVPVGSGGAFTSREVSITFRKGFKCTLFFGGSGVPLRAVQMSATVNFFLRAVSTTSRVWLVQSTASDCMETGF
jgi:hypothetical protein